MTAHPGSAAQPVPLVQFDTYLPDAATQLLQPVCASSQWLRTVVADRPYRTLEVLSAHSDDVIAALPWSEIEDALAAHPRIGERRAATPTGAREAAWSRGEQSGAASASQPVAEALRAGNLEYEQRFGRVFLICATGLSAERMLAALRQRLDNDEQAERLVVRAELAAIVRLRLAKALR